MDGKRSWRRHKTEPKLRGWGKAISYLLKSLAEADALPQAKQGAPIDNNIVERALKKAILNRKKKKTHSSTRR